MSQIKAVPIAPPTAQSTYNPTGNGGARERAIAKLTAGSTEQVAPVSNPTSVSPEELSVVSPQKEEEIVQKDILETSSEEPKEETKEPKEDPLSSQYAILARKEKALRAKVQAQEASFKAQAEALAAREEAYKAKEAEYQNGFISKDRITQDPLTVLTELGVSYDQLTQLILNPPAQQDPATKMAVQKMQEEIKRLEKAQEDTRKSYQDQQTQAYQQAVNQIRSEVKQLVSSDETFETIRETNSSEDVVDLIERTFKEEKILLTPQEAAQMVEDHLLEEALKLTKLKKIQSKLTPAPAAPKSPENPKQPQQQTMKTLTNSVGSSRQLSARERALLAFKGELKS